MKRAAAGTDRRRSGKDPAVDNVIAFTGGTKARPIRRRMFIALKPLERAQDQRRPGYRAAPQEGRAASPGVNLYLQAVQDVRIGGRIEQRAVSVHAAERRPQRAEPVGAEAARRRLRKLPQLTDVSSDQQNSGLAGQPGRRSRHRLAPGTLARRLIDNTLYDAFGQRQVSTMYTQLNQYHVVMEVAAAVLAEIPTRSTQIYVRSAHSARQVPLSAFTHFEPRRRPRSRSTIRGSSRR